MMILFPLLVILSAPRGLFAAEDPELAALLKKAESGDKTALYHVGLYYQLQSEAPDAPAKAREFHRKALAAGEVQAEWALGTLLLRGLGGPADVDQGIALLLKAATDGRVQAVYELALAHLDGLGVPKDEAKARLMLAAAADKGFLPARGKLEMLDDVGRIHDESDVEALKNAARAGDAEAAFTVGRAYHQGLGVAPNLVEAFTWFHSAAKAGHPHALAVAGVFLREGLGVPKDLEKAVALLEQAAHLGNPTGLFTLADMLLKGEGVKSDPDRAWRLVEEAAQKDYEPAVELLAEKRVLGGADIAARRALEALFAKADQGDPAANLLLGTMLLDARKTKPEPRKAAPFLRRAAEAGNPEAQAVLACLLRRGLAVDQDPAAADDWLVKAKKGGFSEALLGRNETGPCIPPLAIGLHRPKD